MGMLVWFAGDGSPPIEFARVEDVMIKNPLYEGPSIEDRARRAGLGRQEDDNEAPQGQSQMLPPSPPSGRSPMVAVERRAPVVADDEDAPTEFSQMDACSRSIWSSVLGASYVDMLDRTADPRRAYEVAREQADGAVAQHEEYESARAQARANEG